MNVDLVKDNPDGSAVFNFDMSPEEVTALVRFGIIKALEAAIAKADLEYTPDKEPNE